MTTLMPATLTAIPGIYDNDLTQVVVSTATGKEAHTVEFWTQWLSEGGRGKHVLDNSEDPIEIHALTLAELAQPQHGRYTNYTTLSHVASYQHAAKETCELLIASGFLDDVDLNDMKDSLATFMNLPEIGLEEALTGRSTPQDSFATCLEETSFYWMDFEYEVLAKFLERATNRKVWWAIATAMG